MNLERLHDTLIRVAEFLDAYSDVVDGSYGEPQPNQAMQLVQAVELEIALVERARELEAMIGTRAPQESDLAIFRAVRRKLDAAPVPTENRQIWPPSPNAAPSVPEEKK